MQLLFMCGVFINGRTGDGGVGDNGGGGSGLDLVGCCESKAMRFLIGFECMPTN